MRIMVGALLGTALISAPAAVHAQRSAHGFLFGEPGAALTLRGGYALPRAGSDIFSYSIEQLTLGRRDFAGPAWGLELAFPVSSRAEMAFGVMSSGSSAQSEYRRWLGDDDLPIAQTTGFRRVPVTASMRAYLLPPGRSIGRFVWVPSKLAPYVGAGAGVEWYRFTQRGEFVDEGTLDVVRDELRSSGWTPTAHVLAGFDVSLTTRLALSTEGRYSWARANLGDDFEGFQKIDLSGFATTIGLKLRF
jgi:opacity protein-like surface antigen